LFTNKFSSARQLKNHFELFSPFLEKQRESQMGHLKKKKDKLSVSPPVGKKTVAGTFTHNPQRM